MLRITLIAMLGFVAATSAIPTPSTSGVIRENRTSTEIHHGGMSTGATADCGRGVDPFGNCCPDGAQYTGGDGWGQGIQLTNNDFNQPVSFYFYMNQCDYVPMKYINLGPGETQFVQLPGNFQGRITRGTDDMNLNGNPQLLGTWMEFSFDPSGNGWLWGDVSLIRGYDGAVSFCATDGSNECRGFSQDILPGAPDSAKAYKPNGAPALAPTEDGNWDSDNWCLQNVQGVAYCDDSHGSPDIVSTNGAFDVIFWGSYIH